MQAFKTRKEKGLGLSDRVWNITEQTRAQVETAITVALEKGTSAQKLSQDIRQCLNNPDMMYRRYYVNRVLPNGEKKKVAEWRRRVTDADGKVHFVKQDLEHTGRGVYRSSYKNAMRLARTETNMAYHKADSNYYQRSNIILGIEVILSNNHTTKIGDGNKTVPLVDICDELKGRYPKEFDFVGWHPQCRCVTVPIRPDRAEMREYLRKIANGEDVSNWKWTGEVTELPAEFTGWMEENAGRLQKMQAKGTLPYFVRNNFAVIRTNTGYSIKDFSFNSMSGIGYKKGEYVNISESKAIDVYGN